MFVEKITYKECQYQGCDRPVIGKSKYCEKHKITVKNERTKEWLRRERDNKEKVH